MRAVAGLGLLILLILGDAAFTAADEPGIEFFERKIRPLLVEHCYECHSTQAKTPKGGLQLDSRTGIFRGGDSGPLVASDQPSESLLLAAVTYSGQFYDMPPKGKLPDRAIAAFRQWIEMGAPVPDDGTTAPRSNDSEIDIERGRDFWSFQPVREQPRPKVSAPQWPRTKIDDFVLRALDQQDMQPAPEADRRTLLRRLSFDLTGLPPTFEAVEEFAADDSPDAYERAVDRLLASPHYGERWGRHWLDVARYAEDNPTSESTCKPPRFPHAYRDWVIRAFNADLPYDEFVRRQLAADLIEGLEPSERAALGFLGLSPVYHKEPKLAADVIAVIVADEWDERLDTITRGFLGLTVACARCHDHKFDPITTEDYYALAGVMASTQLVEWPLVETTTQTAEALTETRRQIVDYELRRNYAKEMRETAREKGNDPRPYQAAFEEFDATLKQLKERQLFDGPIANAVRDAGLWINGDDPDWTILDYKPGQARDLPVFIRGSVTNRGKIVPRRFLEVLSPGPPEPFRNGSGRLELAESLLNEARSLTARVIVNRVWGWHFGTPLVTTPSNFGALGDRPSHPLLLDDLAARFIAHGWSLKWLHREIVLSATYRQSVRSAESYAETDPDNRLLWRANVRRLEPEVWRDAVLAVSGRLEHRMGGPSSDLNSLENHHRTVYGTVSRQKPADVLQLFDFPDAKRHTDRRILTTTPLQQLYLLNSPFVQENAAALVDALSPQERQSPETAVRAIFRRVLQRDPTEEERTGALQLVRSNAESISRDDLRVLAHSLLAGNEFLYVD